MAEPHGTSKKEALQAVAEAPAASASFMPHASAVQGKGGQGKGGQGRGDTWLADTIEHEIIPRLLMAHRVPPALAALGGGGMSAVSEEDVIALEQLLLHGDDSLALAFIDGIRERGITLEAIYLDLLSPAARMLGDGWDTDRLDFTQVTLGLARLHRLLHDLRLAMFPMGHHDSPGQRTILLAPMPHEQHTLGLLILGDFFRKAGWRVNEELAPSEGTLLDHVARTPYDAVGLSISCDRWSDAASDVLLALRRASCNPDLRIVVGGRAVSSDLDGAAKLGADVVACDGPSAVQKMDDLVHVPVRH